MSKLSVKFLVALIIIMTINSLSLYSQSVAITDDDAYSPDASAILDIKSTDKGMLIPRMVTVARLAIVSPATGLMVYDTDLNNFYYYNGIIWMGLPQVGVSGFGGPLFHVVNTYGDTIFAVYDDGVQIIVPEGVKGKVGGFAVSGRSPSKGVPEDYLVITPDSARIYINDTVTTKGKVGGFAVSGRSPSKGTSNDIFFASVDSTRIYVDETSAKGKVGGFAVSGRSPSKSTTSNFLNLSSENYFIGRNSGINNTTGTYNFFAGDSSGYKNTVGSKNIFLGYASGLNNVGEGLAFGSHNIFIGYQAGYTNDLGFNNIFLGYQAGYSNLGGIGEEGSFNTFIGYETGFKSQIGGSNTFLGYQAGFENHQGNHNTYLGRWSGAESTDGSYNVFVGTEAGRYEMGSYRLCINAINFAGYMPPLIYGEFDNRIVIIDGDAGNNPMGLKFFVNGSAGGPENWTVTVKKEDFKSTKYIENSLEKVTQLNGISYIKTDEKGEMSNHIGIDPESAVKIIPEIVKDNGEVYGIEYSKISVLLIEAIKEQQIQINELKKLVKISIYKWFYDEIFLWSYRQIFVFVILSCV